MPSPKNIVFGLVVALALGLIGAIPFGILGLIFGGVEIAREFYLIQAVILGSWLPLKVLIDNYVKDNSEWRNMPDIPFNPAWIVVLIFVAMMSTIVLYFFTATALLITTLTYMFSQSAIFAAIAGLIVQIVMIYRTAQREKALGINNRMFSRVQTFSQNSFVVEINPDTVRRQTPREVEPQVIYLPEENLRDRSEDISEQPPMTITIDPDTVSEQSDDEA